MYGSKNDFYLAFVQLCSGDHNSEQLLSAVAKDSIFKTTVLPVIGYRAYKCRSTETLSQCFVRRACPSKVNM